VQIIPSKTFLNDLDNISKKTARILRDKLKIILINPTYFKRVKGFNYDIFRIRIKDKRIVYLIRNNKIYLICILKRKYNYQDLKKYLHQLGYL
jgi:mRNA-degrading endonuclease RelE of RelBE toxin-antitoxin system